MAPARAMVILYTKKRKKSTIALDILGNYLYNGRRGDYMKKLHLFYLPLLAVLLISCVAREPAAEVKNDRGGIVLMYHMVSENPRDFSDFCVSPQVLEQDIRYFLSRGYHFITTSKLQESNQTFLKTLESPGKFVILTFDDGYQSDLSYVLPLLEKYQIPATFYITAGLIGQPDYLSYRELKQLSRSEYVEFGNHGNQIHGYPLKNVKRLYAKYKAYGYILNDFTKNEEIIYAATGKRTASIAYPYGFFTNALDGLMRQSFGMVTFSTDFGPVLFPLNQNPIKRINRSPAVTLEQIIND